MSKGRRLLFALMSGLLIGLAFPDYNLWPLGWVGLFPLLMAMRGASYGRSFLYSIGAGLLFSCLTMNWMATLSYWVGAVVLLGAVTLFFYLSFYWGLFGLAANYFQRTSPFVALISLPSLWALLEYLQAHLFTGLGWNLLGYSQRPDLKLIQWASFGGVYGISFLLVLVNCLVAQGLMEIKDRGKAIVKLLFALAIIIASHIFGGMLIREEGAGEQLRVGVIQSNFSLDVKWNPEYTHYIFDVQRELTERAVAEGASMVVWPESAAPDLFLQSPWVKWTSHLAQDNHIYLLIGSDHYNGEEDKYYNSAFFIDPDGRLLDRYDKMHLVPFGEYVPLKRFFPFLGKVVFLISDFSAGNRATLFQVDDKPFGALICFEASIPHVVRKFTTQGARFMVQMSNNGWFGHSSQPHQDLTLAIFRAIENRLPLVRATNTGVSGFVDAYGRLNKRVYSPLEGDIFVRGLSVQTINTSFTPSFYKAHGDLFLLIALFLLVIGALLCYYKTIFERHQAPIFKR